MKIYHPIVGTENLKKSRPNISWNQINKIFVREIAFLAVLNFFPIQNMIFGHIWNGNKWNLVKKYFVKLIYLISRVFFGLDFLKFSGQLCRAQTVDF